MPKSIGRLVFWGKKLHKRDVVTKLAGFSDAQFDPKQHTIAGRQSSYHHAYIFFTEPPTPGGGG